MFKNVNCFKETTDWNLSDISFKLYELLKNKKNFPKLKEIDIKENT